MSLRSKLKDKLSSHLSESVTEKLHHFIGEGGEDASTKKRSTSSHSLPVVSLANLEKSTSGAGSTQERHSTEMDDSFGNKLDIHNLSESDGFEVIDSKDQMKTVQQSEMYEQQLTQLQEQLVSAMIENQNMAAELHQLKQERGSGQIEKELEYEKKKNSELIQKISRMTPSNVSLKGHSSKDMAASSEPPRDSNVVALQDATPNFFDKLSDFFLNQYYEILEDFSVTSEDVPTNEVTESLAVKTLRANVKRFSSGVQPIFDSIDGFSQLFTWQTPLLTGSVFALFMYTCWQGLLLPTLLLLLVCRLFLNLLEEWKLIPPVHLLPHKPKKPDEIGDTSSVSEKFNIVLQVATKVQNTLGYLADNLEKLSNLLTWKQPSCTKQIFLPLCVLCVMSSIVTMDTLVMLGGFGLGIKLFIVDPVYKRYPRIKAKYDSTDKLWNELMTDAQLEKQRKIAANNKVVLSRTQSGKKIPASNIVSEELSEEDKQFCERFHLPLGERPVKNSVFKDGRNCIHIEKGTAIKFSTALNYYAKLYLTPHFLCYELVREEDREVIPLDDITRIEKGKALSFLPGSGMALEVYVKGFEKPHVFAGLHHRDACYNDLIERGKANGFDYAIGVSTVETELRLSDLGERLESNLAEQLSPS